MSKLEKALKGKSLLAQEIITGIAELLDIREPPKITVTPQQIINKLRGIHGINFQTYESGSFDALSLTISKVVPPVTDKDLELLANWLDSQGLNWWRQREITVTWKHVCKYFVDWLTRAREFDKPQEPYESVIR